MPLDPYFTSRVPARDKNEIFFEIQKKNFVRRAVINRTGGVASFRRNFRACKNLAVNANIK